MNDVEHLHRLLELADQIDADEAAERKTFIRQTARALAHRVPEFFAQCATEITDEPGHCDGSHPPTEHVTAWTSEKMLLVCPPMTTDTKKTPGFAVTLAGELIEISESGSAPPGSDQRHIRREYKPASDIELDHLQSIATMLQTMLDCATGKSALTYECRDLSYDAIPRQKPH